MITAAAIIVGCAVVAIVALAVTVANWLDWDGTLGPAWWLTLPARLVMPNTGHHRDKLRMTPAPEHGPVQESRPGGPPREDGAVRAAATMTLPSPGASPAGRGQSQEPGGAPPWAASIPPGAAGAVPALNGPPVPPGAGQHPFDDHPAERQPWLYTVGYGPFERGPRAVITSGHVSLRRTGGFPAIEGPVAPVRPYAEQWWREWDAAVNE